MIFKRMFCCKKILFFRIFDQASWLFLLISIVSVSLTCVILASISHTYGVITMDNTMMILLPFQMLLGEQLESGEWFVKKVYMEE